MIRLEKLPGRIAVLYLDNPPLNILNLQMTGQLIDLTTQIENDDEIRVLIITGAGEKAFCAGADIKEFVAVRDHVVEKKLRRENEALLKIENLSKPVIAAINGVALGGGCEIALACDIRFMDEDLKMGLPEVKLGVFPGSGGLYRLPEIVGISHAMELMYTGEMISAQEAFRIGLINHITEPHHALSSAKELAEKIAKQPKHSLSFIKQGVRRSMELNRHDAIEYNLELSDKVFKTEDCDEGVKAFFEKRAPHFK
ncbi:MAG: enoyl-CoA hydratase/isomerase family protein [Chitinophagaceae bacterium]|nr:enoyl-CoA hydratase/isomerase family protein [Chitinophagaceae bacterium]